jgi:hypothetical protein
MSFACEFCVRRLGLHRAPSYATKEELLEHIKMCHSPPRPLELQLAREVQEFNRSEQRLEVAVCQLLRWVESKAVVGPTGEPYRAILRKARELGLNGK